MNLLAELLCHTALLNSAPTPGGGVSGDGYVIPTSNPRILFSNTDFVDKMASAVLSNSDAYLRIKNICDNRIKITATLHTGYYDALMYQITKDETYATYAYNEVMSFLTAEETKIGNQTPTTVEFDSYLYIGSIFSELMLSLDWCNHKFSDTEKQRLFDYVNRGLDNIVDPGNAVWGSRSASWSGWAVDAPTNNYFNSRFLAFTSVVLGSFGDNGRASEWLNYMVDDRIPLLVSDLSTMLPEGGSLEGTNYAMSLSQNWMSFWIWKLSTGYTFFDQNEFAKKTIYWFIHNLSPDGKYFLASGDQSREATGLYMDYGRANFLGLMTLYPTEPGSRVAKTIMQSINSTEMWSNANASADLIWSDENVIAADPTILNTHYMNLKGGLASFRSSWNPDATWVTQQVGVAYESHQHAVNGAFEIFQNEWLFDTHSRRSYNGLLAHPAANNNSRFDLSAGVDADGMPTDTILESGTIRVGHEYPTYYPVWTKHYNDDYVWYSEANLKDAFFDRVEVVKDRRCLLILKNPNSENITVISFDEMVTNSASVHKVFQLNTGYQPVISGETFTLTNGLSMAKVYAVDDASAWDLINLPVGGLSARAGYRAERRISNDVRANFLNVIDVGIDIASVVPEVESGVKKATINFTDGRVATVAFNTTMPGGYLTYTSSLGETLYSGQLPTDFNTYGYLA